MRPNISKEQRDAAWEAVGGLTQAAKMPWYSYALPAGIACPGSAERCKDPKSICRVCYAKKGRYLFANVRDKSRRRYEIVSKIDTHPSTFVLNSEGLHWTAQMTLLLRYEAARAKEKDPAFVPRFRWHDSGDLISVPYTLCIVNVAYRCPDILFWLPTQEPQYVHEAHRLDKSKGWPHNLCVRVGLSQIDPPADTLELWTRKPFPEATWSFVTEDETKVTCPGTLYTKTCDEANCHQCWSNRVNLVKYRRH